MEFERSYEVLVAGAGVAGVAAALEAARAGLRTALVEKTLLLGGLATSGLVDIYLPLCDGNGTQVTFGIAEELLHLATRYGPGDVPESWHRGRGLPEPLRYRVAFSPAAFALALDEAVVEAGISLWLDTLVCLPVMEGDRLVGLEVENKSGRGLLRAGCVVDATGDADVAHRMGAECASGDNWLTLWALQARLERARRAAARGNGALLHDGIRLGSDNAGRGSGVEGRGGETGGQCRVTRGEGWNEESRARSSLGTGNSALVTAPRAWHGGCAEDVTQFALASRKLLTDHYRALYALHGPDERHNQFPLALPSLPQFRTTRRIVGRATMTDGQHGQPVADSVGLVADWRKAGYVWEIPYGALVPHRGRGLLAAGRCISSEKDAWEVTRSIPAAALTGQVAGLAATLAVRSATTPDRLAATDVQERLTAMGIPLHLRDIGL